MDIDTEVNPQFYVNVADIDHLQTLDHYVACTTEKIFQSKTQLYDVFVDQQNITSSKVILEPLLKVSPTDELKYERLNDIRSGNEAVEVYKLCSLVELRVEKSDYSVVAGQWVGLDPTMMTTLALLSKLVLYRCISFPCRHNSIY